MSLRSKVSRWIRGYSRDAESLPTILDVYVFTDEINPLDKPLASGRFELEQFHRYCNVWIESLNHAFAFSGVMSAMASVIA